QTHFARRGHQRDDSQAFPGRGSQRITPNVAPTKHRITKPSRGGRTERQEIPSNQDRGRLWLWRLFRRHLNLPPTTPHRHLVSCVPEICRFGGPNVQYTDPPLHFP